MQRNSNARPSCFSSCANTQVNPRTILSAMSIYDGQISCYTRFIGGTMMQKNLVLEKKTLREAKRLLTEIMENYMEERPVTITLEHGNHKEFFEVVPKNLKHQLAPMSFVITPVSPTEIETITEPGLYISDEALQMDPETVVTNYFGLFVDPEHNRDLRYFSSKDKCIDWLNKKIKMMNS